ncbi:MAG: AAA family ATPase [Candidatus Methanofastidiosia archaeon]
MTQLILIVGMPGCGKGEFISIAKEYRYTPLVMGDVVREEAIKRGFDIKDSGNIAKQLRDEGGSAAIAHLTLQKIGKEKNYIIDGVRSISEVEEFKKHFDTVLIAIHSPPHARFERLRRRGREDDPKTYEEFNTRDRRELGFGLGGAIAMADFMIINEECIGTMQKNVRECLERLRENGF